MGQQADANYTANQYWWGIYQRWMARETQLRSDTNGKFMSWVKKNKALYGRPPTGPSGTVAPAGEQQPPTKSKKSKKARKPEPEAPGDGGGAPSVAAHPKAARQVARAKGWGGLVGFLLSGYLSLPTDTFAGAILRALVGGSICYLAAWAGAVFVWRRLVMLEYAGARARVDLIA